jgi:hypothetical protein
MYLIYKNISPHIWLTDISLVTAAATGSRLQNVKVN